MDKIIDRYFAARISGVTSATLELGNSTVANATKTRTFALFRGLKSTATINLSLRDG